MVAGFFALPNSDSLRHSFIPNLMRDQSADDTITCQLTLLMNNQLSTHSANEQSPVNSLCYWTITCQLTLLRNNHLSTHSANEQSAVNSICYWTISWWLNLLVNDEQSADDSKCWWLYPQMTLSAYYFISWCLHPQISRSTDYSINW